MPADILFPGPFQALFVPKTYKVFYGGRDAAKSWGFARALLVQGAQRKLKILCARELQKSISESVHALLEQQIYRMELGGFYWVEKAKIYGENGTEFSFEGIKQNVNAIRSYEGIDICWVEEAATVSAHSWDVLIPTVLRRDGAEIWVSFNPELETDDTYKRFVKDAKLVKVDGSSRFASPVKCPIMESDRVILIKTSWRDNPWVTRTMLVEIEALKESNYDKYLHVYEGATVQHLEGAVYAKELRAAQLEGRICSVPYERDVPVDTFWDLGRANNTAIWFVQRVAMQWRILEYYEANREELSFYLKFCQSRGYFFGTMFLPHDAKHKRLGYSQSVEEQFRNSGYRVQIVPPSSLDDGINAARVVLPNCYFDETKCEDGLNALRHYCFKVDNRGQLSEKPQHDWASDGADAFRYFAVSTKTPRARSGNVIPLGERLNRRDVTGAKFREVRGQGWMG
jgi:phage terminase large subunit